MKNTTKILIGVGSAVVLGAVVYFGFIRKAKSSESKPKDEGKGKGDADSAKILLVKELVSRSLKPSFFTGKQREYYEKNQYDFWMTKSLKEIQDELDKLKK